MKQQIPMPVVVVIVLVLVAIAGVFLFRGATGGVQGDGKVGNIEAAPPIPKGAAGPGAPPNAGTPR